MQNMQNYAEYTPNMHQLCKEYAHTKTICRKYAQNMPEIYRNTKNMQNIHKACTKYAEVCRTYGQNMHTY